jgi:hypothetical protein
VTFWFITIRYNPKSGQWPLVLLLVKQQSFLLVVRLAAPGTPYRTLRRAVVRSWRFSRRTSVRYVGRDIPFPSRKRQIKRVLGRALRPARPHLACPRHHNKERRGEEREEARSSREKMGLPHTGDVEQLPEDLPGSSSSSPAPVRIHPRAHPPTRV